MEPLLTVELVCLRVEARKTACTPLPPEVDRDYIAPEEPEGEPWAAGLPEQEVAYNEVVGFVAAANACSVARPLHSHNLHKVPVVQRWASPEWLVETTACHSMMLLDFATEDCKAVDRAAVVERPAASSPNNQQMVEGEGLEVKAAADAGMMEEEQTGSCASLTLATNLSPMVHRAKNTMCSALDDYERRRQTRLCRIWIS